jgi:hypothetical protein
MGDWFEQDDTMHERARKGRTTMGLRLEDLDEDDRATLRRQAMKEMLAEVDPGTKKLTFDDLRGMDAAAINANWTAVQAALAAGPDIDPDAA